MRSVSRAAETQGRRDVTGEIGARAWDNAGREEGHENVGEPITVRLDGHGVDNRHAAEQNSQQHRRDELLSRAR
jgi:hypothetical protein